MQLILCIFLNKHTIWRTEYHIYFWYDILKWQNRYTIKYWIVGVHLPLTPLLSISAQFSAFHIPPLSAIFHHFKPPPQQKNTVFDSYVYKAFYLIIHKLSILYLLLLLMKT